MARPSKPWYRASKGTWYCTIDGKKISLGVQGRENKRAAEEAWHRLMAGLNEERARPKAEPTAADVIKHFLADCEGRVKPRTVRYYRDFLTPFAERHGSLKSSALTPTTAEAYSRKPEWSASTRHDFLGTLAGAFRWAERAKLIDRTPLLGLRRPPKASRGLDALVSSDEQVGLLASATPQFRLVLETLWGTGARPGEVARITAENFDPDAGVVRLKEHKTAHKGKARFLLLSPALVQMLLRQRERYPSGPLLRNRCGKPWTEWAITKAMQATRGRAGIPHAIAYGLRHTFATDALANGVPDAQVAELLGHSGTAMLHKHYSHLTARTKVLREALERVRGTDELGPCRDGEAGPRDVRGG